MKVLFVCGSYPPGTDSMGDVAAIMVNILEDRGINVEVMGNIDWSISQWPQIKKRVKDSMADVIHVQYPTHGFKYSITPQMLSYLNRKKTIITIHEVSQARFIRKLSLLPFSFCRKVVFTNEYEKNYYKKIYPWTKNMLVVPIGSNIHAITKLDFLSRRSDNIVHFGQIRPNKGIEQVIELARIIKEKKMSYRVIIMGRTYDQFISFYNEMKEISKDLPVDWLLNLSEDEVSEVLGSNTISYLPYPDGVTERRGSMFASMVHHNLIFTTKSEQTPAEFDNIVVYKDTAQQMGDFISGPNVKAKLNELNDKFKPAIDAFMLKYNWNSIMTEYIKLYNQI